MSSGNPWKENRLACVSLGSVDDILTIASQQGYSISSSDVASTSPSSCHSLQLIATLRELSSLHTDLDNVNSQLQVLAEQHLTADITDTTKAETWLEDVKSLSDHLSKLLNDKQHLVSLLTQPLAGQHLPLAAKYHSAVADLYPQLMKLLSSLPDRLSALQWMAKTLPAAGGKTSTKQLGEMSSHWFPRLANTTEALSVLQTQFRRLHNSQQVMAKLSASSPLSTQPS